MEPWTPEWKEQRLADLKQEWVNCAACPLAKTRQCVVFGAGNPNADIVFVGEKPDVSEEEAGGVPFSGNVGGLLDSMLEFADLTRDAVYMTNLVGCRTPGGRTPTKDELTACRSRLHQIIYTIDPLMIVSVGAEALASLTKSRKPISSMHGQLQSPGAVIQGVLFPRTDELKKQWDLTYPLVPILHPGNILREDEYNKLTQSFKKNGIAEQTYQNVFKIAELVRTMKRGYEQSQKLGDQ